MEEEGGWGLLQVGTKKAPDVLGCTGKSISSSSGKGSCPSAQPCKAHLECCASSGLQRDWELQEKGAR